MTSCRLNTWFCRKFSFLLPTRHFLPLINSKAVPEKVLRQIFAFFCRNSANSTSFGSAQSADCALRVLRKNHFTTHLVSLLRFRFPISANFSLQKNPRLQSDMFRRTWQRRFAFFQFAFRSLLLSSNILCSAVPLRKPCADLPCRIPFPIGYFPVPLLVRKRRLAVRPTPLERVGFCCLYNHYTTLFRFVNTFFEKI